MPPALRKFLFCTAGIYLALCACFYFFQGLFYFHPISLPADHKFLFDARFSESYLNVPGGKISLVRFYPADSIRKGVVLYFHGNKNNIERYASYADAFTRNGYECWMIDYPGYGKSTGELNQQAIENVALEVYRLATSSQATARIVIYGKSLGTGPAAFLASKRRCRLLVLETPYLSMHSMSMRYTSFIPVKWLIRMDFTPETYLHGLSIPIIVFHGSQDEVIPFSEAMKLQRVLKKSDRFVCIPNTKHNGLDTALVYRRMVDSALAD